LICERIFKLPEGYIKNALEELLLLVKYGNFSWGDVKVMPTSERKFYINKLIEYNQKAAEERQ
jgi:hypothetical protein